MFEQQYRLAIEIKHLLDVRASGASHLMPAIWRNRESRDVLRHCCHIALGTEQA